MYIRFAEKKDIPAIIRLLQQVGQVHHRIRPDLFRSGAQKYDEAALAQLLQDNRTLYIDDLCVDETSRGKHVGQALYNHACAYARELRCNSLTLNVWFGNDSAMAFYEKQGLKPRKIYMEMDLEGN